MNKCWWRRIKYVLVALFGCLLVLVLWSLVEPYRLDRNIVNVNVPALPQPWQGKQIAVVADFQIGMWMANTSTIEQAIAQIITDRPAAALIAGDFVYQPGANLQPELDQVVDLVRPLVTAQIPTYAVLGNHDYGVKTLMQPDTDAQQRASQIQQALESIGIRVLQNEAIVLSNASQTSERERLYLVGIGAYLAKQSQPLQAIARIRTQGQQGSQED